MTLTSADTTPSLQEPSLTLKTIRLPWTMSVSSGTAVHSLLVCCLWTLRGPLLPVPALVGPTYYVNNWWNSITSIPEPDVLHQPLHRCPLTEIDLGCFPLQQLLRCNFTFLPNMWLRCRITHTHNYPLHTLHLHSLHHQLLSPSPQLQAWSC